MNSVTIMSFGFKHRKPDNADIIIDVRSLPNPYRVPSLCSLTGLDEPIQKYIMSFETSKTIVDTIVEFTKLLIPYFEKEKKRAPIIAIGCTGGRHRSVAISQIISARLIELNFIVDIIHKNIGDK